MNRSTFMRLVQRGLWRAMRQRGHGAISRIERRLGWPRNGLRSRRDRKGGLRLEELGAVLEQLDVPPAAFFADVFDGRAAAADRFLAETARLANVYPWPDLAEPGIPSCLPGDDLAALDSLRFTDAEAAADAACEAAESALRDGRREDAAATLARFASACRVLCRFDEAYAALGRALRLAPEGPVTADCWLRAGSLVSETGAFIDAAELASQALLQFLEIADLVAAGRAPVSRSIFLRRAGAVARAVGGFRAALQLLPDNEARNRYAASLGLGLAYVDLREFGAARQWAQEASAIGAPGYLGLRLFWLEARIAAGSREFGAAIGRNLTATSAIADLYRTAQEGRLTLQIVDKSIMQIRESRIGGQRYSARAATGSTSRSDPHPDQSRTGALLDHPRARFHSDPARPQCARTSRCDRPVTRRNHSDPRRGLFWHH